LSSTPAAPEPATASTSGLDVLETGAAGGMAIRGGALRIVGFGAGMLMSAVSVPLMVRHLGVVDYGFYITVSSIIFIIGGFTEAGLTYLGIREYAVMRGHERQRFMQNLAGLRFALTATGVVAATLFTWVTGQPTIVVQGVLIAGLGLFVSLTQQTYSIPLQAQLRLGWVTTLELIKQGLLTGCVVAFVIVGAGLLPFFVAYVISAVGVLAVTLVLIRREASLRPAFDRASWRRIARETTPYALAAAVGLIYFRLGVVLMSYIASDHETGIYSAAFRIVEIIAVLPWVAVSSGFPILSHAARTDLDRLRYALQRMFETATLVGVGLALAIGLGAQFAIDVIAGPGFDESVPVLRLLGVALVTSFLVATFSFALLSLKAYRALLICNALAAAVVAAGTIALEPPLGAEGAAIATVVGEAVLAGAYVVALRQHAAELIPHPAIVVKALVAVAVGCLAGLLPVHSLIAAVVGCGAYVAVAFAIGAVPHEILAAMRHRHR
jgi:O-antigen/teichoic acid export membrane protein